MTKSGKFIKFLNTLQTSENSKLLESVKQGFRAVVESFDYDDGTFDSSKLTAEEKEMEYPTGGGRGYFVTVSSDKYIADMLSNYKPVSPKKFSFHAMEELGLIINGTGWENIKPKWESVKLSSDAKQIIATGKFDISSHASHAFPVHEPLTMIFERQDGKEFSEDEMDWVKPIDATSGAATGRFQDLPRKGPWSK